VLLGFAEWGCFKKVGGCPPEEQPPQQHYPIYLNHTDVAVRGLLLECSVRRGIAAVDADRSFQFTMGILETPVTTARLFSKILRELELVRIPEKSVFINN
jgi:hypothetical protein